MKGYTQVYTGNGKGKSTAAFGLAFKASGAGKKVFIGQFVKGKMYSEIRDLIRNKPEKLELVLTGRYAPEEILELADLFTEMKEVRHYYQDGVKAREGIEY